MRLEQLISGAGAISYLCIGVVLVSEDGAINFRGLSN